MARKRLLSPEFFMHGELYDAEASSKLPLRLAFAGLWTACDRRGLFAWKPRELKLSILPYDPVDFAAVLDALERAGFIRRYVVEGKPFGVIPSFARWQTFHKHEKPSDCPEPPDGGGEPAIGGSEPASDGNMDVASTAITVAVAVTGTGTEPIAVTSAEAVPADDQSVSRPPLIGESALAAKFATDNDRMALTALLHAVPNRLAWTAEMGAALQGMHGFMLTPEQLGECVRDYVANGHHQQPALRHFRAYMQRAGRAPPTGPLAGTIATQLDQWMKTSDAKDKRHA